MNLYGNEIGLDWHNVSAIEYGPIQNFRSSDKTVYSRDVTFRTDEIDHYSKDAKRTKALTVKLFAHSPEALMAPYRSAGEAERSEKGLVANEAK